MIEPGQQHQHGVGRSPRAGHSGPLGAAGDPRAGYGSAAELAGYAGLSTKTIRRLVGSGRLRGRKVGRRLLIAFDDLDGLLALDHTPTGRPGPGRGAPPPDRPDPLAALDGLAAGDGDEDDEDDHAAAFAMLAVDLDAHRPASRGRFRP